MVLGGFEGLASDDSTSHRLSCSCDVSLFEAISSGGTVQELFVHDESAHPHGREDPGGSARATMMAWVRRIENNLRISNKAFLGLEANAASGVLGRRAASSASVIIIVLVAIVFMVFVVSGIVGHFDMRAKRHARTADEAKLEKVAQA